MNDKNTDICLSPDIHSSSLEYKRRFQGEFGSWALSVQGRIVEKILGKYTNIKTILDVGGGHGQLCPYLEGKGYKVTILASKEGCEHQVEEYLKNDNISLKIGKFL